MTARRSPARAGVTADARTVQTPKRSALEHAGVGASRKYRNEPVVTADGRFDSKGEYGRWCALKIAERAGWIRNLRRQVRYVLLPGKRGDGIELVADFAYEHANGTAVVEDFKSPASMTPVFKLKLRLFRHAYPETVFLISGKDGAIKRASDRAMVQPTPEDAP